MTTQAPMDVQAVIDRWRADNFGAVHTVAADVMLGRNADPDEVRECFIAMYSEWKTVRRKLASVTAHRDSLLPLTDVRPPKYRVGDTVMLADPEEYSEEPGGRYPVQFVKLMASGKWRYTIAIDDIVVSWNWEEDLKPADTPA